MKPHRPLDSFAFAVEEAKLCVAWNRLESAGLSPILIKGWSTARLYPWPGSRGLGDFDFCFAPEEVSNALDVKREHAHDLRNSDLHSGCPDLTDRTWTELFARSRIIPARRANIRVLAVEEHLRLTCLHLVRHGGGSQKMLLDVAAILNVLPESFHWEECLRGDCRASQWVLAIVGLAARNLNAKIKDPDIQKQAACPDWLAEDMPQIWEAWEQERYEPNLIARKGLFHDESWKILRYSWLNPILASLHTGKLPRNRAQLIAAQIGFASWRRLPTLLLRPLRPFRPAMFVRRKFAKVHT